MKLVAKGSDGKSYFELWREVISLVVAFYILVPLGCSSV